MPSIIQAEVLVKNGPSVIYIVDSLLHNKFSRLEVTMQGSNIWYRNLALSPEWPGDEANCK